jgi:hypothetical protein
MSYELYNARNKNIAYLAVISLLYQSKLGAKEENISIASALQMSCCSETPFSALKTRFLGLSREYTGHFTFKPDTA